jgi:hypothetical protein
MRSIGHRLVAASRFESIVAAPRQPGLRDQVKLNSQQELRGLQPEMVVEIVQVKLHERNGDTNTTPYQVCLRNHRTPWFSADELILANPMERQPPPQRPAADECCGSSCPNCVWIVYRQEQREWNALRHDIAQRASLPLPAAVINTCASSSPAPISSKMPCI